MSLEATLASAPGIRPVTLGPQDVDVEYRADGSILLRSPQPLGAYPDKLTERLEFWAEETPSQVFLAQRDANGDWRTITYEQALEFARRIGEALLARNLSAERPLVILSGNDIEHALLALGALYAGVPYAPISPAYALMSGDFGKLRSIVGLADAGARLCRRRRDVRHGDRSDGAGRCRNRGDAQRAGGPTAHDPLRRLTRTTPTARGRRRACRGRPRHASPSSCSPRARPACPKA